MANDGIKQIKKDLADFVAAKVDGADHFYEMEGLERMRKAALEVPLMPNTRLALERCEGRRGLIEALGRAHVDLSTVREIGT